MVKVVELKNRAIERLEVFRDTPSTLPALVHARYLTAPSKGHVGASRIKGTGFALRRHKPHQMHTQHRSSNVKVLQLLIKRLDMRSRECVFVNPARGIRRPLYVPEIARETGLSDRTVTRCLGSLTRSGYVFRSAKRFFLSLRLFRDLALDVSFHRLLKQLEGLAKKKSAPDKKPPVPATLPSPAAPASQILKAADHTPLSEASRAIGNEFLNSLRRKRKASPAVDPPG